MKRTDFSTGLFMLLFVTVTALISAQSTPVWINNLDKEYPSNEWVAAVGYANNRPMAEQAAMNNLARVLKTNTANIARINEKFDKIVTEAGKKKTVSFNQSRNFSHQVAITANIQGLIGVEIDHFEIRNGTHYICARMNRAECAKRYNAIVQENTDVINKLVNIANGFPAGFEKYAVLNYASSVAEITDSFQSILEILDTTAQARRPSYGKADTLKLKAKEVAGGINVGIQMPTGETGANAAEMALIKRTLTSFFTEKGFKTNDQGQGNYVLVFYIRLDQTGTEQGRTCRYYVTASLERAGKVIYSYKEDDSAMHARSEEAQRLAVKVLETSIKDGKFSQGFDVWLGSMIE